MIQQSPNIHILLYHLRVSKSEATSITHSEAKRLWEKIKLKTILSLSALFICSFTMNSANYTYSSSEAGTISDKTFTAGDVITLKDGDWNNKTLRLRGSGTVSKPILVNAQTPGKVILKGSSTLSIDGKYIEVSGLSFEGNSTVSKNHVVTFTKNSANCRFTNSAIRNYNPANQTAWADTDNKWISINGKNNRVDHCYFENKGNIGTLLVVWLVSGQSANHQIDNNHFYKRIALLDEEGKELNGQETIRIGDSSTSMTNANCIIENNFFEECNGEIEIISNKSCSNIYRHNVFYNNEGMLTLRHGNSCDVNSNYFLGNNLSRAGGVRIIGENHKVYNNYFQDIKGSGYRSALCMVNGKKNSELTEYFQVKNAFVAFNTFYNCANVFTIGYDGGKDLAPIGCMICHNVIYSTTSNQTGVNITNSQSEVTWKNNLMYQGRFTNFSPATSQFQRTTTNLNFRQTNTTYGIYEPTAQSMIASGYKTTDNPEITNDIEGRTRPSQRMIGAFEIAGNSTISIPTPHTVGCSFINKNSSNMNECEYTTTNNLIKDLFIIDKQLTIKTDENILSLRIYNMNGQLVHIPVLKSVNGMQQTSLPDNLKGFYLLRFNTKHRIETRKFLFY